MKKLINNKSFISCLTVAALLCGAAMADEFGDFADFGDTGSSSTPSVTVNGKASLDVRGYVDEKDTEKMDVKAIPDASLGFEFKGNISDSLVKLRVNEEIIKNHPIDVLDEIELNAFFGPVTLSAGKMKNVWGKGDKLHVIDNFNADDYSDFIVPDYLDRRVSTPMVKVGVNLGAANMRLEGVYTPLLPVDRFATKGRWTPAQVSGLTNSVKSSATGKVAEAFGNYNSALVNMTVAMDAYTQVQNATTGAALQQAQAQLTSAATTYMTALTNANALNSDPEKVYPDMNTLKYGQFGARLTGTAGPVDLGVSYYNGYYKQPSCNAAKMDSWVTKTLAGTATESDKFLAYDKKQTFGAEFATTLWHFNLRGEAAYNLTEDIDGNDPWVHNNSVAWLGGFDIDLPLWNMNLNVQETGTYVLNNDSVNKNKLDVDYSKTGYSANKVVTNLSASFVNDTVVPEVTVVYGIEKGDLAVLPKVSYKVLDGLTLSASGLYIWTKDSDSEFYAWRNNSFVNLGAVYQF